MSLWNEKDKAINFIEDALNQPENILYNIPTLIGIIQKVIEINEHEGGFAKQNKLFRTLESKLLKIKQKNKVNNLKSLKKLMKRIKVTNY